MSTTDLQKCDRAAAIMEDVANYIDALAADSYHDRWVELWTAKIDTVAEELRELADIIAELETASNHRLLNKIDKNASHGSCSR